MRISDFGLRNEKDGRCEGMRAKCGCRINIIDLILNVRHFSSL